MKSKIFALSLILLTANMGLAQDTNYPKAKVSFNDFKGLVAEVEFHRSNRLIDLNTFLKMSKEPGVIILDSRSDFRFDRIHVKGAKHLAFTDFTQENLKKVIPRFETKILIYCNNNFDGNQTDFGSKVAAPRPKPANAVASQFASQTKPLMMALNIPTYVNLYGYGYYNVYELNELVKVNDPRIAFEGSVAEQKDAPTALDATKVLEIARRTVAANDTWLADAEFEQPQHGINGKGWSVLVWRLPKTPGGQRLILIDETGKVTDYIRGL